MSNSFHLSNGASQSPAPAVERAFAILRWLSQAQEPQGVSALARALGLGKSTVHGILQALLSVGAIEDTGGKQFRLGPLIETLGRSRRGTRSLAEICEGHLERLVDHTGQTSIFGKPDGDRFRIVTVVEGRGPLRVKAVPGSSIPLLAGVVGKIAMAWELVPIPAVLPRFTEDSVVDARALEKELVQVRKETLALDRGEYLRGVYAAASPILKEDDVVGVLFSAGFQDQVGDEGLISLGHAVVQAASEVSKDLLDWSVET